MASRFVVQGGGRVAWVVVVGSDACAEPVESDCEKGESREETGRRHANGRAAIREKH